jgi:hypothetical protein
MSGNAILASLQLIDIVDIIIFFALEYLSYILFYFVQKVDPGKGVTPSIFLLCFGINLIALSFLFRIGREVNASQFVTFSILGGSLAILIGGIFVYYRKTVQIADLRRRQDEILKIIESLKKRYYKQEISEEDLKSVNTQLIKELTEIEVKLKEKKEDKKSKKKIELDYDKSDNDDVDS